MISDRYEVDGCEIEIGVSIGIAQSFSCEGGIPKAERIEQVRQADIAMYRAKRNPHVNHELYDDPFFGVIEDDLDNGRWHFAYQSQTLLETRAIVRCEALFRWNEGTAGYEAGSAGHLKSIVHFENEYVTQFAHATLQRAAGQMKEWLDSTNFVSKNSDFTIEVNLSPRVFEKSDVRLDLTQIVKTAFTNAGLPKDQWYRIGIEITERIPLEDEEYANSLLTYLGDRYHMRASYDDLDMMTAIKHLRKLRRIRTIKLDKEHILGMDVDEDQRAFVSGLAALFKEYGNRQIVAEHVESPELFELVKEAGIAISQGYFDGREMEGGKPQPAKEYLQRLNRYANADSIVKLVPRAG